VRSSTAESKICLERHAARDEIEQGRTHAQGSDRDGRKAFRTAQHEHPAPNVCMQGWHDIAAKLREPRRTRLYQCESTGT
jgi:hypothetical protein